MVGSVVAGEADAGRTRRVARIRSGRDRGPGLRVDLLSLKIKGVQRLGVPVVIRVGDDELQVVLDDDHRVRHPVCIGVVGRRTQIDRPVGSLERDLLARLHLGTGIELHVVLLFGLRQR